MSIEIAVIAAMFLIAKYVNTENTKTTSYRLYAHRSTSFYDLTKLQQNRLVAIYNESTSKYVALLLCSSVLLHRFLNLQRCT